MSTLSHLEQDSANIHQAVGADSGALPHWETGRFFSREYRLENTIVPFGLESEYIGPDIFGFESHVRGGSTAFWATLLNQGIFDRGYHQPEKALLRHGGPQFILYESDANVLIKSTHGPIDEQENMDTVGLLIAKGVSPEKIKWVFGVRDPRKAYASLLSYTDIPDPETFVNAWRQSIRNYERYRDLIGEAVPLVYDLFGSGEQAVWDRIILSLGLPLEAANLEFDRSVIENCIELGEATEPEYYGDFVEPVFSSDGFHYSQRSRELTDDQQRKINEVWALCGAEYERYTELSKDYLGIVQGSSWG